jgi:hypothetical protein
MSKYRAIKTNGYDSKKEAARATQLKVMQAAGLITELKEQVVFVIAPSVVIQGRKRPPMKYIADFEYMDMSKPIGQRLIIEDVKGMLTPIYKLKRHLMMAVHGIEISER